MTEDSVLQILKEAIFVVFKIAGPLLIISMLVGLVIAVFQAATQVHEQTLTFVPKALTIILLLLLMGSFMINTISGFCDSIFDMIVNISTQTVTG
ncbi:MAG: flagellar biosynthesis protein FliQ [Huintestinicola sp.]